MRSFRPVVGGELRGPTSSCTLRAAGDKPNYSPTDPLAVRRGSFDESQCTIVFLLEEGLGYGLVVLFPAYGFAALVSHNENLNSPKQVGKYAGKRQKAAVF